jgi:hypothetical protein
MLLTGPHSSRPKVSAKRPAGQWDDYLVPGMSSLIDPALKPAKVSTERCIE